MQVNGVTINFTDLEYTCFVNGEKYEGKIEDGKKVIKNCSLDN